MTEDGVVVITTLALYFAAVASPGPSFLLVTRTAVAGEREASFGAVLGLAIASAVYAVSTMAGVSVLLSEVGWIARLVQVLGGIYLLVMGWRLVRTPPAPVENCRRPSASRLGWLSGLKQGLLVNLSNPKGIAFFVGLYAAAVPPSTSLGARLVILAAAFVIEVAWYGAVALTFSSEPVRRASRRIALIIDRAAGLLFMAFGARILLALRA